MHTEVNSQMYTFHESDPCMYLLKNDNKKSEKTPWNITKKTPAPLCLTQTLCLHLFGPWWISLTDLRR